MANKNFTEFSLDELYTGGYIVGYIHSGVNGERRWDISGFSQTVHSHAEYVGTGDSRLTDARTPTAHTHGNITNSGTVGHLAGYPLITSTGGLVQTLLRTELPWATGVAPDCDEGFSRFVNLTGNMVINPPINGRDGAVFKLRALAVGSGRSLTFHTDIKKPIGITYTGAIASGSTRITELEHNGTSWLLIKNLEFTA